MATLDIHFLDVGQGDGTFIIFPGGTTMLVDLGSKLNASDAGGDAIKFIVNALGAKTTIERLFITHSDEDHYNLLPDLVAAIPGLTFGAAYIGGAIADYSHAIRTKVFPKCGSVKVFPAKAHDLPTSPRWTVGGVKIYLLSVNHPGGSGSTVSNASSIVLMLDYHGKVILPGDAEASVEKFIMGQYTPAFLRSGVLKLGHHGSKSATKLDWINTVNPDVIFASADRKWSHPYSAVLNRFKNTRPVNDTSDPVGLDGNSSLIELYKHSIVSGTSAGSDYYNTELKSAVFTNVVYIHTSGLLKGLVIGTQYLLEMDGTGKGSVNNLDKTSVWFNL